MPKPKKEIKPDPDILTKKMPTGVQFTITDEHQNIIAQLRIETKDYESARILERYGNVTYCVYC